MLTLGFPLTAVEAQEPVPASPQCTMPDTSVHALPFSREDDADGARYVWFTNCRAGLPYAYVKAKDIPQSRAFRELDPKLPGELPRGGDIVWWPTFVAVIETADGPTVGPAGRLTLANLTRDLGQPPRFFRRQIPVTSRPQ